MGRELRLQLDHARTRQAAQVDVRFTQLVGREHVLVLTTQAQRLGDQILEHTCEREDLAPVGVEILVDDLGLDLLASERELNVWVREAVTVPRLEVPRVAQEEVQRAMREHARVHGIRLLYRSAGHGC